MVDIIIVTTFKRDYVFIHISRSCLFVKGVTRGAYLGNKIVIQGKEGILCALVLSFIKWGKKRTCNNIVMKNRCYLVYSEGTSC